MQTSIIPVNVGFPTKKTINRLHIDTINWQRILDGVLFHVTGQSVKLVPGFRKDVDAEGNETQVEIQVEQVENLEAVVVKLDNQQWDEWPSGDRESDEAYIESCVLKNLGLVKQ